MNLSKYKISCILVDSQVQLDKKYARKEIYTQMWFLGYTNKYSVKSIIPKQFWEEYNKLLANGQMLI
jgi:hypothetical protein